MDGMLKLIRAAALALAVLAPAKALAEPPLWVIKDKDSTITLFGSVHILPEGMNWRPKALDKALAGADDIWFEIPIDDATRLAAGQAAMMRAMLPAGQSLRALLDDQTRARFDRVAASLNLPLGALDRLRPWMAELTFSQALMERRGANISQGVEHVIAAQVSPKTRRRALETPEQQLALYADSPMKDQLAMLAETVRSIEDEPNAFDDIVGLWLKSDVVGMVRDAVQPLKETSPTIYEAMITRRNADWVRQITQRLAGKGDTVMVVGVGHLVGPDSVPAMLRQRGVEVSGP